MSSHVAPCTQNNPKGRFSRALRLIRDFLGLDQGEFARILGISRSYLSEIETGEKEVTLPILSRYAEILDVPLSSLLVLAEAVPEEQPTSKVRMKVAPKVLRILEWLAARSESREQMGRAEEAK